MSEFIRQHDGRMTRVIKQGGVSADQPIRYLLTIELQWRARFAMRKRRDHRRWAEQGIPLRKEPLPGDHGLVTPVERFEVLGEGGRWLIGLRLECADHHAD